MALTEHRGESRFYLHADGSASPGVTSIVGMEPKPFLPRWAAGMTADLALSSIGYLQDLAQHDRRGAYEYLRDASDRYKRSRGNLGTKFHIVAERMLRGEDPGPVHPDIAAYVPRFAEFLRRVNPELLYAEEAVWSRRHDYMGSFDAIVRVWYGPDGQPTPDRSGEPRVEIVDWKTSKSAYPSVGLQLAAYARADWIMRADSERLPVPAVSGGRVLHISGTHADWIPVEIGGDVFADFLALRRIFDWDRLRSRQVLGTPLRVSGAGGTVTGTQRRAL